MLDFQPYPGLELSIGIETYRFLPHPLLPPEINEVWVVEGGEALLYRLQAVTSATQVALKLMKAPFRGAHLAYSLAALASLAGQPGFRAAQRLWLTAEHYPALIARYPALREAIVMPWLPGVAWASCIAQPAARAGYTHTQARQLAVATARILATWEAAHLAHTDIAGGNVLISPNGAGSEIIDCERIYGPGAAQPLRLSLGSPGYQHPHLGPLGQWCATGDRFAGAVLLTEMLTWWAPTVRAMVPTAADTLFQPDEIGALDTPKWHAVRNALWTICPDALVLFDLAWTSPTLDDCPPLRAWADTLA